MTRPRRPRAHAVDLTDEEWARLLGRAEAGFFAERTSAELWAAHGADALQAWMAVLPGTRPPLWWVYAAPRAAPGTWTGMRADAPTWPGGDELRPDPRRRLGGIGTPAHECLAHGPNYARGIPMAWVNPSDVATYNGKPLADGRPLPGCRPGHFPYFAPDAADPPKFESEASYLLRHGLLLPGERGRLRPADFRPWRLGDPVPALPDDDGDV